MKVNSKVSPFKPNISFSVTRVITDSVVHDSRVRYRGITALGGVASEQERVCARTQPGLCAVPACGCIPHCESFRAGVGEGERALVKGNTGEVEEETVEAGEEEVGVEAPVRAAQQLAQARVRPRDYQRFWGDREC